VVGALRGGSGGQDWPPWRRLGGEPERREEPPHRVGLGHRAQDPARAGTAIAGQDVDREHAAQQPGDRKATAEEAQEVKRWLVSIAQRTAEAAKEGGVLDSAASE
jgi:hypothetical protein